jgi:hypothetical protein
MYSYYRIYVIGTNSVVWTEVGTPCRATPCPHLFRFLFFFINIKTEQQEWQKCTEIYPKKCVLLSC